MQILKKQVTPESIEFAQAGRKLIFHKFNPFLTQKQKTKILNEFIEGLSEDTMRMYIDTILLQVNMTDGESKQYLNTTTQVDSIIKRLPRLGNHRNRLFETVRKARRKFGLAV